MDAEAILKAQQAGMEQGARLEALKLAAAGRDGWEASDIIRKAEEFFRYIMDGKNGDRS